MLIKKASILENIAVKSGLAPWVTRKLKSHFYILMFHGVSPYSHTPELFEEQLIYIKNNFTTHWASEIPELLKQTHIPKKPPLLLTFDDGLKNNLTYAAPLLEKYNIKATFYIISELLDGQKMLWAYEIMCRLLLLENSNLPVEITQEAPLFPEEKGARKHAIEQFIEQVKNWPSHKRLLLLKTLRTIEPDIVYENWMMEEFEIMNEQELKSLPDLIEIGAHTLTHPILDKQPFHEAKKEIVESKKQLEAITGKPIHTFCYPNGNFSSELIDVVRTHYDAAVSVNPGTVQPGDALHTLNRIPASNHSVQELVYDFFACAIKTAGIDLKITSR